jgi:hypothetical protein
MNKGRSVSLVLGLLALAAVPCLAKNVTCHDWNMFAEAGKEGQMVQTYFMMGFQEGVAGGAVGVALELENGPTLSDKTRAAATDTISKFYAPAGFINGDLLKGVSAICSRPENTLIPVAEVLPAFIMQVQGKPQSEIDAFLAHARKIAIENQDSGKPN